MARIAHWLGAEAVLVPPAHVHRLQELDDRLCRWEPRAGRRFALSFLLIGGQFVQWQNASA